MADGAARDGDGRRGVGREGGALTPRASRSVPTTDLEPEPLLDELGVPAARWRFAGRNATPPSAASTDAVKRDGSLLRIRIDVVSTRPVASTT